MNAVTDQKSVEDARQLGAVPVEITGGQTPWNEVVLADGNRLRVHIQIEAVYRLERAPLDSGGMPAYAITSRLAMQAFPSKKRSEDDWRAAEVEQLRTEYKQLKERHHHDPD